MRTDIITGSRFEHMVYIDDIALITDNREKIIKIAEEVENFTVFSGMDVNTKKSSYTSTKNQDVEEGLLYKGQPYAIHFKNEAYEYLGIWIAIDLTTQRQVQKI